MIDKYAFHQRWGRPYGSGRVLGIVPCHGHWWSPRWPLSTSRPRALRVAGNRSRNAKPSPFATTSKAEVNKHRKYDAPVATMKFILLLLNICRHCLQRLKSVESGLNSTRPLLTGCVRRRRRLLEISFITHSTEEKTRFGPKAAARPVRKEAAGASGSGWDARKKKSENFPAESERHDCLRQLRVAGTSTRLYAPRLAARLHTIT